MELPPSTTPPPVKVLSYGGGLDSFAMLLDALRRGEKPDLVIFADVADPEHQDPGEWPGTYQHLRDVVIPLCQREGVEFKWLGTEESPIRGERSLFAYFEKKHIMPSRQSRLCTSAAKVERIAEYLETRYPEPQPIEVWIGFEAGEEERAARDPHAKGKGGRKKGRRTNRFPLMEHGICRCRAEQIARSSGLPVPRGSACSYCPFGSRGDFQTLFRELPETFARVQALEDGCRKTKKGRTVRFSGTEGDPRLTAWVTPKYKRKGKPCAVCGAEVKAAKLVGCRPPPPAAPPRQRALPILRA